MDDECVVNNLLCKHCRWKTLRCMKIDPWRVILIMYMYYHEYHSCNIDEEILHRDGRVQEVDGGRSVIIMFIYI